MSTLRSEIIDRVYAECADFVERHELLTGVGELVASLIGPVLVAEWGKGMYPKFLLTRDVVLMTWKSEDRWQEDTSPMIGAIDLWSANVGNSKWQQL